MDTSILGAAQPTQEPFNSATADVFRPSQSIPPPPPPPPPPPSIPSSSLPTASLSTSLQSLNLHQPFDEPPSLLRDVGHHQNRSHHASRSVYISMDESSAPQPPSPTSLSTESPPHSLPPLLHRRYYSIRHRPSRTLESFNPTVYFLLLLIPLALLAGLRSFPAPIIFALNVAALVPLTVLIARATEDLATHIGNTTGAVLTVSFANAVELIFCLSALRATQLDFVQQLLIGCVLNNLLLVLGSALFCGGLRFHEQLVRPVVSEANANLLSFAILALAVPTLFSMTRTHTTRSLDLLSLSTAIALLLIYAMFLLFQLYTHTDLYRVARPDAIVSTDASAGTPLLRGRRSTQRGVWRGRSDDDVWSASGDGASDEDADGIERERGWESSPQARAGPQLVGMGTNENFGDDDETTRVYMSPAVAAATLVMALTTTTVTAELVIRSLPELCRALGGLIGEGFVGLVILPICVNVVQQVSAVMTARAGKMDVAVGIACGTCVRVALFVAPIVVVVSWFPGFKHLTLDFGLMLTLCLTGAVLVANATLRDRRTNWLEGALLIVSYAILTTAFFFMR